MKNNKLLSVLITFIMLSISLTACANTPGEQGPKGEQGIPGLNGSDGRDGKDGSDGKNGSNGKDGSQGPQGEKGNDGVSIVSIIKTSSEGLVDTYTITYSDNKTSTFTITNGEKGDKGEDGETPYIGDNGNWWINETDTGISASGIKEESKLQGLNVLCVGDSITAGQGLTTQTRWANVLANKYNWNLSVQAQGGISMSNYYYRENEQTEVGCVSKIDYIANMSVKPDLVIVWGGHNDASYRHSPLGSFDDVSVKDTKGALATFADRYSFKGSIRYISEVVHKYAPKATLVFLTTEWTSTTPKNLQIPEGTSDTTMDFKEAIMNSGWRFGYNPIDMSLCGITPWTLSETTSDNVHPNEKGTKLIVDYLSSSLEDLHYILDD